MSMLEQFAARSMRNGFAARRQFVTSAGRQRDVLARFHRPAEFDAFLTSSTIPAGTSFQEIPPPGALHGHADLQKPVPAMEIPKAKTPAEDGVDVQGIHVPPKPRPPGDEECCMSGCVHCVYTIYAEELEEYSDALEKARKALVAAKVPEKDWPLALKPLEGQGGKKMVEEAKKKMEEAMDPTMAAFFALENKLKKKQAPESSAAS